MRLMGLFAANRTDGRKASQVTGGGFNPPIEFEPRMTRRGSSAIEVPWGVSELLREGETTEGHESTRINAGRL